MVIYSRYLAVAVLMLCPAVCQAAEPKATASAPADHVSIVGPSDVPVGGLCIVTVQGLKATDPLSWVAVPETQIADLVDRSGQPVLLVPTNTVGTYSLVLAFSDDGKLTQKVHVVRVGQPVPPVPPDPTPIPVPPPVPTDKLTVLILEETADRGKLPPSQLAALTSTKVREYLNGHKAAWHQWDDDYAAEQVGFMDATFKAAYERAKADSKGSLPWLIVSNGAAGISAPLPKTEAETIELLKKYGGN